MKTMKFLSVARIAIISLAVIGCRNPFGFARNNANPEHEHEYTVKVSSETYYENVRWKDKSGKELEEGEEGYWVTAAYPTETEPHYVLRRGSGIEVVKTLYECEARDGATHTEYVRGEKKHFESEPRALAADEELVDGKIVNKTVETD